MRSAVRALTIEKDKQRGLVPSRAFGSKDKVYGAYLTHINPRENGHVQKALACSADPRFREFLSRIQTNRYKRVSLQTIAKACSIDLKEFNDWWNRESTQTAIAIAQNSSVDITSDMVADARTTETACERCDGMTWIGAPAGLPLETPGYRPMQSGEEIAWIRDCPNCEGGKTRKIGDSHSRDRVLELSGLIKKGGGVSVNVNNFGGASHASAVADLDGVMTMDVGFDEV